jgi:FkbM family methyltransferase
LNAIHSLRGVRVAGKHFDLPAGTLLTIEEPWMGDVLLRLLPYFDGDFVDVGANVGQTLLQLRAIDLKRRYVGFEPNPNCASYVSELVRLNEFDATELVPVACGQDFGIRRLYFYQDSSFDSSATLVSNFRPNQKITQTAYVVTAPVSECLAAMGIDSVGLIKIDIEGFEATVIQSLTREIEKHRPCVILEVLPVYSDENISRLANNRKIEEIVASYKYTICRVLKTRAGRLDRFLPLCGFGVNDDMNLVDYVLLPNEAVSRVVAGDE